MATWDLRRLQQFLDKHPPDQLYLLFGEESYLIDEALGLIRARALQEGAVDFNFDQFYYPETSAAHVRDVVETLPVMCERRVVFFKGVEDLKEKDWEVLMPILEEPVDTCVFVLVGEKVDKRKKYFKKISEEGIVLELKRPFDNQVPAWIDYIAFKNDVEMGPETVSLVHQLVGSNLAEVNNEMKKLKQYLGDRREATNDDVLKVVSHARIDSIFDLTNAIGRQDRVSALVHLAQLLESGQNEVGALLLILRHMRIIANLKVGIKQGLSGAKLSAKAGISSYFLKQYLDQCRMWGEDKIELTMEALQRTDKALKSSPVSAHIWLENFIVQTCS